MADRASEYFYSDLVRSRDAAHRCHASALWRTTRWWVRVLERKITLETKFPWAKTASSTTAKVPHWVPFPLVRRLHQICLTAVADFLAYDDLGPQQYSALACVDDFPGDQRRLAAMMGVDRTNVGMILDQLEAKGFVERKVNGADRRARELFVTRSGHNKRQQVRPKLLAAQARVLAPLNDGERDQLIELLVRLIEANEVEARPGAGRRPAPRKANAKSRNGGLDAPDQYDLDGPPAASPRWSSRRRPRYSAVFALAMRWPELT